MPCDQRRTVSVDLTIANKERLVAALKVDGFTLYSESPEYIEGRTPQGVRFTIDDGRLELEGGRVRQQDAEKVAAQVNQAYTKETTRVIAKRHGFTLKTNATSGQMTLTRRTF